MAALSKPFLEATESVFRMTLRLLPVISLMCGVSIVAYLSVVIARGLRQRPCPCTPAPPETIAARAACHGN